jgi:hypothetical protein
MSIKRKMRLLRTIERIQPQRIVEGVKKLLAAHKRLQLGHSTPATGSSAQGDKA